MKQTDVIEIAKECGATLDWRSDMGSWRGKVRLVTLTYDQLQAFANAVLMKGADKCERTDFIDREITYAYSDGKNVCISTLEAMATEE